MTSASCLSTTPSPPAAKSTKAQCLCSLVRVGRPRPDGLGRNGNSLSQRAGWRVATDYFALFGRDGNSLSQRAGQIVRYLNCFRCSDSHILSGGSCERRASPNFSHSVGSVMTKSLGQAFSKACRSRAASWSPVATGEIFLPQNQHRTGRVHTPQCMDPWEDPCKGSSFEKGPLDAGLFQ